MWGAAPHPDYGERNICASPPRAPTVRELYMRGFTPHPDRRWYGHRPYPDRGGIHPTSRACFGKKRPKNPKKPNCGGFILSSIDSEQGCRRQPCFVFWQSNSNFIVSLPNASKGREGATVPAVAALTLPRPAQGREKDNSFPPLCIPPFL